MNVNPEAFTILCFGDSNTFGQPSERSGRWPADVRWTGQLQRLLGADYEIIEEGLGGRTTDLDDPDRGDRNGRKYLQPCLRSHSPLDMVVIMLGNNDVKTKFDREADAIASALEGYIDNIENTAWTRSGGTPAVILISPIHLDANQPAFAEQSSEYNADSVRKSRELATSVRRVANRRGVMFLDAADVARPGRDGIHLSLESHDRLSRLIGDRVAQYRNTSRPSKSSA